MRTAGGAARCGRGARWRRCGAGRSPPPLPAASPRPFPSPRPLPPRRKRARTAAWRGAAPGRRLGAPRAWRSGRTARPRGRPWRCGAASTAPPAGSWRCAGPACSSAPSAPSPPPSGWRPTASSCSARYEAGRTRAPGAAPGGPRVPPNSMVLSAAIFITLIGLIIYLHFVKIDQESLLVIGSLGIQVTSSYASGKESTTFIEMSRVKDVVINEAIHMQKVIYYLCILLKDPQDPQGVSEVVPLFQNSFLSFD